MSKPVRINPDGSTDYPVDEVCAEMDRLIKQGCIVFVKYTCDKCGERVTSNVPNSFAREGYIHEEKGDGTPCGHLTVPIGINQLTISSTDPKKQQQLLEAILGKQGLGKGN
jgi:hypothetical protein